jgi:hypothetical protein
MNPQIKQKWLNALRSGEYQQTQERLRKEDGFCCLGVLCDLYGKENNVEWQHNEVDGYFYEKNSAVLPLSVMEWADVDGRWGDICNRTETLARLNDRGSTFEQIANLIEEQL